MAAMTVMVCIGSLADIQTETLPPPRLRRLGPAPSYLIMLAKITSGHQVTVSKGILEALGNPSHVEIEVPATASCLRRGPPT